MALSGTGSISYYTTRTFGPFTRGGVSPWSRTTGLQVTLSCWVRCRAAPSGLQTFFGIGNFLAINFFQLVVDTNFVFRAWYASNTGVAQAIALSASNAAAVGDWVHLMGTLDCTSNPRATLYIGGTSYTAASGSDTSNSTFDNVTLHRAPLWYTTSAATTTDVAEVAVYAGLLSAANAEALRCGQTPVSVEGHRLLAYFPLRGDLQDRSPYATGLTQSFAYTLAWSDHPPVQPPPFRRIRRLAGGTVYTDGVTDSGSSGESVAATQIVLAALADAATGNDSYSVGTTMVPTFIDSGVSTESFAVAADYTALISDSASANESVISGMLLTGAVSDSASANESVIGGMLLTGAVSDSASANESVIGGMLLTGAVSDSASANESVIGGMLLTGAVSDAATGAESLAAAMAFTFALSDSQTGLESVISGAIFNNALLDSLTTADSIIGSLSYSATITAGGTASDSFVDVLALYGVFSMLHVVPTIGRIELVSSGPASVFLGVTEQQSRV